MGGGRGEGPLTQVGDVGPAARRRHDALGAPARNVVVDLGAWDETKMEELTTRPYDSFP